MSKPKTLRQLQNIYKKYLGQQPERVGFAQSRMDSIGGSDLASILGDPDAYYTEYEVYKTKTEVQSDETDNDLLLIGDKLENGILDIYQAKVPSCKVNKNPKRGIIKGHPWLAGNPDGIATDGKKTWGLEVKALGFTDVDNFGNPLEIVGGKIIEPDHKAFVLPKFNYQCQFYMEVFDFPFMDLVVLFKGSNFQVYRIHRHKQLGEYIIFKATDWFFSHVVNRIPPAPSARDVMSDYYSTTNQEIVQLSAAQYEQVMKFKKINNRMKELKEMKEGIQHQLCEFMRGAESAYFQGKEVLTWRHQDNYRLDQAGIKEKYPDFYANNRKNSPSRVFRAK